MSETSVIMHEIKGWGSYRFLLLSDIHWDNPKCDRKLLKRHLDEAKAGGHPILINGDLLDLMGGKKDRRANKETVRPEHQVVNYFDAVVSDCAKFFKPYAELIHLIAYGNHETAIINHQEFDCLRTFAHLIGRTEVLGTYSGWVMYQFKSTGNQGQTLRIKYHHGSGGGGVVTRGAIQFNRMATMVEGADIIWSGHVHESTEIIYSIERLNRNNRPELVNCYMVRTSTYKEEYLPGMGWHVERGAPPKPLGGRWLDVKFGVNGGVPYLKFNTQHAN